MAYANLLVEDAGPVRTVTVNRPKVLNALDGATLQDLWAAFADVEAAPAIRCVILTGAGEKAFVAGADVAAMSTMDSESARALARLGQRVGELVESLDVPVIAAVNGFALGGGLELALLCDFMVAAESAKLGQPEVNLGVIPGFGGTQRLARRVGIARARQLLYTGELLGAAEAHRVGLVNEVVPAARLLPRCQEIAQRIATRAPLAVAAAKRAMNLGADQPLAAGIGYEQQAFAGLFATEDQKEGMAAFLEKRAPRWRGR